MEVRTVASADVQAPLVPVVEQHQLTVPDVAVERERQIDHRDTAALRDKHRHDLDGGGIVVQPAEAFRCAAALVALRPQPVAQGGQAEVLPMRGVLQQLRHMREVRHQPLAALPRQHPVTHAAQLCCREDGGDTPFAGMSRPLPQRLRDAIR